MPLPKFNLIEMSKEECEKLEGWLVYGGCPMPGDCWFCEDVLPEYLEVSGQPDQSFYIECPCDLYGPQDLEEIAVNLLEYNNHGISTATLEALGVDE